MLFWIQAHGLPLGKMNKSYPIELGNMIGDLVETDYIGDGIQLNRSFLCFRVAVDITHPLLSGYNLKR